MDAEKTIKEFADAKAAYEKLVAVKGKELIGGVLAMMFASAPSVTAVRWRQYTPYFNDGEACEFGVNEREVKVGESDDFDYVYGDIRTSLGTEWTRFDHMLDKLEDAFKMAFGDHVQVIATRAGTGVSFEVEEYDHE